MGTHGKRNEIRGAYATALGLACATVVACQDVPETERSHDPLVTPEIEVDEPIAQIGGAGVELAAVAPAFDASSFLAVWKESPHELWAARFGRDGERLEPVSHALGISAERGTALISDQEGYIIAWVDDELLRVSRVTPAGRLTGDAVVLHEGDRFLSISGVAAALAGDRVLVTWIAFGEDDSTLRGQLLSRDLAPITAPFDIFSRFNRFTLFHPSVATDGTDFFVVWRNETIIRGARINHDGIVLDPSSLFVSPFGASGTPSVTYGAGQFLTLWRHGSDPRVSARRYTTQGIVLDEEPIEISHEASINGPSPSPKAIFDGEQFVISWIHRDTRARHVARWLDLDGILTPADQAAAMDPTASGGPVEMAFADNLTMMAHRSRFVLMDSSDPFAPSGKKAMAFQYNAQSDPTLCATETGHLILWRDSRRSGVGHYLVPLADDGSAVGGPARVLPFGLDPKLVCGGNFHLLTWTDGNEVFAQRLTNDGIILDESPISLGTSSSDAPPHAAISEVGALVVFAQFVGGVSRTTGAYPT